MMIAKMRRGTLVRGVHLLTTNYQLPTTNYQLPTTDYRLTFRHDGAREESYGGLCLRIPGHRIQRKTLVRKVREMGIAVG